MVATVWTLRRVVPLLQLPWMASEEGSCPKRIAFDKDVCQHGAQSSQHMTLDSA